MIRCSSISKIMTEPRTKGAEWSETAIAAMMDEVRERLFGVRKSLDDVKCIQKGKACEQQAIDLYNAVFLTDLQKVDEFDRRSNGVITGEPDLIASSIGKGVDIKCSWSLLTFPLTSDQAAKKEYEWQARGYMHLFDLPAWEIAYCMIDTPDELISSWDDLSIHKVDPSIPIHHRITIARYERDAELEAKMLERCARANQWIEQAIKRFAADHDNYIN